MKTTDNGLSVQENIQKKSFIKFLKDHDCYDRFWKNIEEHWWHKDFESMISTTESHEWIDDAFDWTTSPEDWEFWHDLNKKWMWFINHK